MMNQIIKIGTYYSDGQFSHDNLLGYIRKINTKEDVEEIKSGLNVGFEYAFWETKKEALLALRKEFSNPDSLMVVINRQRYIDDIDRLLAELE